MSRRSSGTNAGDGPRERGAAVVEFALVVPLLLTILLGILDYGIAFHDVNSVRYGTREGVRRAVVGDVGVDTSCPILGGGALSADTAALICLTKDKVGLDPGNIRVSIGFDTSYTEGDALILCAQYQLQSVTGFFGPFLDGKMTHSQVDMRIELTDIDGVAVGLEPFQEGGDWSWCG